MKKFALACHKSHQSQVVHIKKLIIIASILCFIFELTHFTNQRMFTHTFFSFINQRKHRKLLFWNFFHPDRKSRRLIPLRAVLVGSKAWRSSSVSCRGTTSFLLPKSCLYFLLHCFEFFPLIFFGKFFYFLLCDFNLDRLQCKILFYDLYTISEKFLMINYFVLFIN